MTRRAFVDDMAQILSKKSLGNMAMVFLNLDHFKDVNDKLGHLTGDKVLQEAAGKLRAILRQDDLIGCFGGDEFMIFLEHISSDGLVHRLEDILVSLREEYCDENHCVQVSASIGAVFIPAGQAAQTNYVLQLADEAMYDAKDDGRNQYKIKEYPMLIMPENLVAIPL